MVVRPRTRRDSRLAAIRGDKAGHPLRAKTKRFMQTVTNLNCFIPRALETALAERAQATGLPVEHLVQTALAQYLSTSFHTLFQVSTSGSLVAGVFEGAVSVADLLRHGDFGLGTLAGLDGEMVVLDGIAYQAKGDGSVHALPGDAKAPFAMVTAFVGDSSREIDSVSSFQELGAACDPVRRSENLFYALRIDGHFEHVHTRVVNPAPPGATLTEAAQTQPEFHFQQLGGTLVGIWSPSFSGAFSVPGYHFHFLSDDRTKSGHLLGCRATRLRLRAEALDNYHLSLPESAAYLQADLSKDTAAALSAAEQAH